MTDKLVEAVAQTLKGTSVAGVYETARQIVEDLRVAEMVRALRAARDEALVGRNDGRVCVFCNEWDEWGAIDHGADCPMPAIEAVLSTPILRDVT